ncbi:hypothetical protein [Paenibacillus graminis]|nr:hypothetical protein [Paenibacillus graminis]MEC0172433.1 hypothetical protein [Paenibacillus graminis]
MNKMCIEPGRRRSEFSEFTKQVGIQPESIAFFQPALAKKQVNNR